MKTIKSRQAIKETLLNPDSDETKILNQCIMRHNEDANPEDQVNERTIVEIKPYEKMWLSDKQKGYTLVNYYVIELNLTYNSSKQYFSVCFCKSNKIWYGSYYIGNKGDVNKKVPNAFQNMCKQPLSV